MLKFFLLSNERVLYIDHTFCNGQSLTVKMLPLIVWSHLLYFSYKKHIRYTKMHPQENLPYKKRIENRQSQEVSFQSASFTRIEFKVSRNIDWFIQSKTINLSLNIVTSFLGTLLFTLGSNVRFIPYVYGLVLVLSLTTKMV